MERPIKSMLFLSYPRIFHVAAGRGCALADAGIKKGLAAAAAAL